MLCCLAGCHPGACACRHHHTRAPGALGCGAAHPGGDGAHACAFPSDPRAGQPAEATQCTGEPSNNNHTLLLPGVPPAPLQSGGLPARFGGFLSTTDLFDVALFGLSGGEAELMDAQQRLLLEASFEVGASKACICSTPELHLRSWPNRINPQGATTRTVVLVAVARLILRKERNSRPSKKPVCPLSTLIRSYPDHLSPV